MDLLIDSHCLLWWFADLPMSAAAFAALGDSANAVYVSPATIWELEIKAALGKLSIDGDLVEEVDRAGMEWLDINALHSRAAARLPPHHHDPFDRMLIAQANLEGCTLVSRDDIFERYSVPLIPA